MSIWTDETPYLGTDGQREPSSDPVHDRAKRSIRMPSGVEPGDVISALLDNAQAAGDAVAAHLWLTDDTSGTLRLIYADGIGRPDDTPVPLDGTVLGHAVTKNVAQIEPIRQVRSSGIESTVWRYALPISAGETTGVAAVDFGGKQRPDLSKLTPVAGAMRGVLAGALALHLARTETNIARSLTETSRVLARLLHPDDVIAEALARAMSLGAAQTGSIMLLDESGAMRISASRGLPAEVVEQTRVALGEGIAGWVLASGKPLVVEDLGEQGPGSRRHGVRSAISVPIADDDGTLGVINVGRRSFHTHISRGHLAALESLGRTTAVALRNAQAATAIRDLYFDTLRAFAMAVEAKDPYAYGATSRVLDIAMELGGYLGMSGDDLDALRAAAILHDIGMAAAGEAVAGQHRQLSTVEWGMLKMHPAIAAEILSEAPALRAAVPIVYHHHERYDGGGYLGGVAAQAIPLGARIIAVADAYVAMTSPRPHRSALTRHEAISELTHNAGSQFDPHVVQAFGELLASGRIDVAD
jgi:HD-GYP domain-containing protein (c-di-GMP phosphodiesterase class II)